MDQFILSINDFGSRNVARRGAARRGFVRAARN